MQLIPTQSARTRPLVLAACLFLFSAFFAAAGPGNDLCSGAEVIPGVGPFPVVSLQRIIDGAGNVGDPPFPPPETSFGTNQSVWYKFTPAASGLYTVSTAYDTGTTIKDTSMAIYTGGNCTNFSIYAYNEDSGTLRAAVSTNLTAGTPYYIVVWIGRTEVITSGMELQVRITKPAIPSNDTCAMAMVIPATISAPYLTPLVDTTRATTTPNLIHQCVTNQNQTPSREVWYQFAPTVSGPYNFSTGPDTATRIEDTSIEIYTGSCGTLNQFSCSDNNYGRARFSQSLTMGVTYYIAVYDNAAKYVPGETDLQLRVAPAMAPTVVTLPPSSITSTSVFLNGTITANGSIPTTNWFEWGPTPSLGSTSQVKRIFDRDSIFTTNALVSGFAPGAPYYYRFVGANPLGRSEGQLQTFTFTNSPPQIATFGFESEFNRTFVVEFAGAASHLYIIQDSTNLVDWSNLGEATEASPGYFSYRHASSGLRLFYRVRQP
jgi:hypothetical protein